jgi:hypothetical protein
LKDIKGIIVLIMAIGLMAILGLIVYDEFSMANEHNAELDQSIIELLQMSITGVIGVVAGFVGARNNCNCKDDR